MDATMNYMLRKTLIPWRMQETIDEVLAYCKANLVTEVIWKIDAEAFNKGFTSQEYVQEYLPWLDKAKKLFDKSNISTSINPWMTLNHADYGRDSRAQFPQFQWMVDYTGAQTKSCPCPLCPSWQDYIAQIYALYAQINPHILWIEDDFRHFNHIPVDWGCFCPLHLEKFSNIIGENVSRDELIESLLRPGQPHPYRKIWMEFLGNNMLGVAEKITKATHLVSSKIKLGLMCSMPSDHSIEGRKWQQLVLAFADGNQPVVRPHYGVYRHERMLDIYCGLEIYRETIHCLPKGTCICPEIENAPFTQFVKSAKYTQLQILLSAAMGNPDVTLNLYDHVGTPLASDDATGLMLRHSRPVAESLLQYCKLGGVQRGIGLLFNPEIAQYAHTLKGERFHELHAHGNGWSVALQAMGQSVSYEQSAVTAITGQITRAYSKEQVLALLSKGILLDSSAAQTLIEDGYSKYIGIDIITTIRENDVPIAAEDLGNQIYISPRLATDKEIITRLHLTKEAKAISNFVDFNRKIYMPAMVAFENSLGGRIATYAMDIREGVRCCFMSWHRQKQFKDIVRWLSRGNVALCAGPGPHAIPLRIDYPDYSIIVVANNSPDVWPYIEIEMDCNGRKISDILAINANGQWSKLNCHTSPTTEGCIQFCIDKPLNYLEMIALCVRFS